MSLSLEQLEARLQAYCQAEDLLHNEDGDCGNDIVFEQYNFVANLFQTEQTKLIDKINKLKGVIK